MKNLYQYMMMAALACVGTMMTGCASDDIATEEPQQKNNNVVTLTTTISLEGSSAGTRALDADGKKTFAKGDQIAMIYKNTNDETVKAVSDALETTDIADDGRTAKITVTLEKPKKEGQLRCIYPASMAETTIDPTVAVNSNENISYAFFQKQDGSLATIGSKYDLAIYDGTFTSDAELPNDVKLPSTITLKNQLTIVEFTIKDYAGNDITSTITDLDIQQGHGKFGYTVAREAASGPIYVAMMPTEGDKENPTEDAKEKISITATDGTTSYFKDVKDVTLKANNMYPVNVTMLDMLHTPLTLEATQDGTTVTVNSLDIKYQYAINGGSKTNVDSQETPSVDIELKAGEFVEFYSTNSELSSNITPNKKTYVYGNVMSLIDNSGQGFANDKTIGPNALKTLFRGATELDFHPKKRIVLPATTLDAYCYEDMFKGCTGLTELPEKLLPATTLGNHCYENMFSGCTGLKTLPANLLPATTLVFNCYEYMFDGCTGLTELPAGLLPATALAQECYKYMFNGCTSLAKLPADLLPATTLKGGCYSYMFNGCTGLTELPANLLPATTLESYCYKYMFNGCTGLKTLPANLLPATTLADYCYQSMFDGCKGLTELPADLLPAGKDRNGSLASFCYDSMFGGCTGLETLPANLLPATTLANGCYNQMFKDCTSLQKSPKLPATNLILGCYNAMFEGCTSLNEAWVKAAFDGNCSNMFNGCTATGAVLHTKSANVDGEHGWNKAGADHKGNFIAQGDWTD